MPLLRDLFTTIVERRTVVLGLGIAMRSWSARFPARDGVNLNDATEAIAAGGGAQPVLPGLAAF